MADELENEEQDVVTDAPTNTDEDIDAKVERLVAERLAKIKGSLDTAYQKRDASEAEKKALAQELNELKRKQLEAEGKKEEALNLHIAELEAQLQAVTAKNTELTRDVELETVLTQLSMGDNPINFKSAKAKQMAISAITKELALVDGNWKHSSGASITDFVKAFANEDDNSFLFSGQANRGTNMTSSTKPTSPEVATKITEMNNTKILEMARQGKLKRNR